MTNTMNMLPNDHHPGPRCSCAECQRRYPEVSEPAPRLSKDQISAERLSDLIASCIFQSETGGHGDGYVAFLYDIACACMELLRRRASLEPWVNAQHEETGNTWFGPRSKLPLRYFEIPTPPPCAGCAETVSLLRRMKDEYIQDGKLSGRLQHEADELLQRLWRSTTTKGENHG